jgi:hypothetical protein
MITYSSLLFHQYIEWYSRHIKWLVPFIMGGNDYEPYQINLNCSAVQFCIIVASSFALSYVNLTTAAIEADINPTLFPLCPLWLDGFLVMGSLFILLANLNRKSQ